MSTQQESPIADLMEDLGMNDSTTDESNDEDLNLNDSDESTQMDDETSSELEEENTSTAEKDDTEDSKILERLEKLEKEREIADKRLTDKDKYINELKQQIDELLGNKKPKEETETAEDEDFWDNPEGFIKKIVDVNEDLKNQLRFANIRIDESAYARDKADYYDLVNAEALKVEFAKNSKFLEEFNSSDRPYEVAYKHMKSKQESSSASEAELEAKIEAKLLAKYGLDKKEKKVPPSINNMGGKSNSSKDDLPTDGFASVFGSGY